MQNIHCLKITYTVLSSMQDKAQSRIEILSRILGSQASTFP